MVILCLEWDCFSYFARAAIPTIKMITMSRISSNLSTAIAITCQIWSLFLLSTSLSTLLSRVKDLPDTSSWSPFSGAAESFLDNCSRFDSSTKPCSWNTINILGCIFLLKTIEWFCDLKGITVVCFDCWNILSMKLLVRVYNKYRYHDEWLWILDQGVNLREISQQSNQLFCH